MESVQFKVNTYNKSVGTCFVHCAAVYYIYDELENIIKASHNNCIFIQTIDTLMKYNLQGLFNNALLHNISHKRSSQIKLNDALATSTLSGGW